MPPPDRIPSEQELVAVIRGLVGELQPERAKAVDISLSSRLERDLGIDSLARTELILRIERTFRVRLPAATIGEAETVRDLLRALEHTEAFWCQWSDRCPARSRWMILADGYCA